MKRKIILTLEVDTNDTLPVIENDISCEIQGCCNTYEIVSIEEETVV